MRILRSVDKSRFYNHFNQIGVTPPLSSTLYLLSKFLATYTTSFHGKYHTILRIRFLIRHTLILRSSFADNFLKNLLKIM